MKDTKIEWTDHTFNHVVGCAKVSPGCAHCYAKTLTERWGKDFSVRRRTSPANWRKVERWNRQAAIPIRAWETMKQCYSVGDEQLTQRGFIKPRRPRVFCASLADWLDDADVVMPDGRIDRGGVETLADLLDLWRRTPNLDWLLLSKRPENWRPRLEQAFEFLNRGQLSGAETWAWLADWIDGRVAPPNVWLGVSAEDQLRADERMNIAETIPAAVRFVSCEPQLEHVDFHYALRKMANKGAQPWAWTIFGAESGTKRRPFEIEWLADGIRQCDEAGVKVFVKQDSALKPGQQGRISDALWRRKEWAEGGVR